jgi:hypothetical protein
MKRRIGREKGRGDGKVRGKETIGREKRRGDGKVRGQEGTKK